MNRRRSRTSFDCPHRRVGCEGYELRAYKLEPITCPFQELAYKIEVLLYAFAPWLMSVRKVDVSDKFCVPHGNPRPTCGICPEHIALEVRIIQFCRYGTDKVRLFLQAAIRAAKEEGGGAAGARGGDDRRTTGGETLPSRVRFFVLYRIICFLRRTIGGPSLLKLRWHWSRPRRRRGPRLGETKATTICFRFNTPLCMFDKHRSCSFSVSGGGQRRRLCLRNPRTPCGASGGWQT